jgi:competence protein ComEA
MSKIRDYFTFTRSERNGILVLLLIILILLISLQVIPRFFDRKQVDYSSFENEIDKFISSVQEKDSSVSEKVNSDSSYISGKYFLFNPNDVTESDLFEMGIPKKVAHAWINYISKGGRFKEKDDVKKIWGLEDSIYQKLVPFIDIPKIENDRKFKNDYPQQGKTNYTKWNNKTSFYDKKDNSIELNSVDSAGLCALPGIGPGFTKRILKYRDLLGGYIAKEQLLEVFGFTSDMYSKIENLIYVETSSVKKLNLNKVEYKQLIRHPYFTKDIVNKILEYRRIQGKISNIQDLVKDKMLTLEQCTKLMPYVEY